MRVEIEDIRIGDTIRWRWVFGRRDEVGTVRAIEADVLVVDRVNNRGNLVTDRVATSLVIKASRFEEARDG